jgi:hypothetical protein
MSTQQFEVWSEKTGKRHTVTLGQSRIHTDTLDGPGSVAGLAEIRLDTGNPLKTLGDGRYGDQWTDETFTTTRPSA